MYALPAMPMPFPSGSLPCFALKSVRCPARSRHSPRPIVVMRRSLIVREFAGCRIRLRYSSGSRLRSWAILSSWASNANRGWVVPCPRFGPHGGLFVYTRTPSNLYAGTRYVTVSRAPV